MKLYQVAYRNLIRKPFRSMLTVCGIATAVMVMLSLSGFDRGYRKALETDIEKMGYQLLITAKGCPYEAATLMLKGGGGLRYMNQNVLKQVSGDRRVAALTAQLAVTSFDPEKNNGNGGFSIFMGIEDSYLTLKPWTKVIKGKWFTSDSSEEAIFGYEAAELEQRTPGDLIFIPGIDKELKVAGVLERTGSQDDGVIFLPLKTAQKIFNLDDKLTGIGIRLTDLAELESFENDAYSLPDTQVISMAQVKGTIFNLVSSARVMSSAVAVIALFIAIIGVLNTILMSVIERIPEIGLMRAIGASRKDVFFLIWLETGVLCFAGGMSGIFAALTAGDLLETLIRRLLPYAPGGTLIIISAELICYTMAGTILSGLIAGTFPALRASSLMPAESVRKGGVI